MCDSDFDSAKSLLANRLRALDPAGPAGFEGLMRDALTEITGQLFRLAKSGPQGGTDVRSVGANTVRIGLEGKRYGATTTLGFDELQAKLVDAAHQDDPVDLWLLAATREIDAGDIERLERVGKQHGVTAVVLDWPPSPGNLPDLAMICIEAPEAVKLHLGQDVALVEAIKALSAHPDASSIRERLRRQLLSPDIGYAAAVNAMHAWMRNALASESNAAARLGSGFNNLAQTSTKCISRVSLNAALDQWLERRRTTALLGDEGVGKTWSFLSWWLTRLEELHALPLTLFVSAKEIRDDDIEMLLSRLLAKRLDHGDAQFWKRRINQWRRTPFVSPQFILVIDGLNENWSRNDWAEFLQPLYDEKWAGRFAILLTCWPDHWNQLRNLAPLVPKPDEINVGLFDDRELDDLLALHGLDRSHFSREMLDLMKVPRLSALAIERRADLATSGDITPERLAYEDWKHRLRRRGARLAVDDEEFQDFVVECGRALKASLDGANFSRAELINRLSRNSGAAPEGLRETVSELIAGRWLERSGRSNQFRVQKNLVPFALGMTLARELRDKSAGHSAEEIISSFLDPYRGQRLGVAILRSAITAALLDDGVGREDRAAILSRWINERNFAHIDFEAYPRLLGLDFELFCQITEFTWLSPDGRSSFTDEILIKGLANAFDYPEVAMRLKDRVTTWLGWVWDTGDVRSNLDVSGGATSKIRGAIPHDLACWHNATVAAGLPRIDLGPEGDIGALAKSALGVISFLPRADFIQAFVAWALSRAVMGTPHDIDELSWVVRISENDDPGFRPALYVEIDRLCDTRNPIATVAASWLLQALGDPKAEARLAALDEAVGQENQEHGAAASIATLVENDDPFAVSAARLTPDNFNGRELWLHSRQSAAADHHFEHGRVGLARSDPNRLRDILGEAAMSAVERSPSELDGLVLNLPTFQFVLTPVERAVVAASVARMLQDEAVLASDDQVHWWRTRQLAMSLWGLPADQQLKILVDTGMNLKAVSELLPIIEVPEPNILRAALNHFPAPGADDAALAWLHYLSRRGKREALEGWAGAAELVTSDNDALRTGALEIAFMTRERKTMEAVASDSRAPRDAENIGERGHGSLALWIAGEVLARPDLLDRADAEIAAPRLRSSPGDAEALRDYDLYVRKTLEDLDLKISRSFPSRWARHKEATTTLVTNNTTDFIDWLRNWLGAHKEIPNFALMEQFPLGVLCEGLMKSNPELGLDLWRKLNAASDSGAVKNRQLAFLPFEAPIGAAGDAGRHEALLRAATDKDLLDLAVAARKGGREDWLEGQIRRDEASGESGRIARAYSLLGFTDDADNFTAVWSEFEGRRPRLGWLAEVYNSAQKTFQRNQSARGSYQSYLAAADPIAALAAHDLLVNSVDGRAPLWIKDKEIRSLERGFRSHWIANAEKLKGAIERRSDHLKETLFFTKTARYLLWPWL